MSTEKPATYEEFWPYYVSQHMDPTCRKLHFVGTGLALWNLAISPLFPPALLAAPVYGYGFAWLGHFAFEKNKPASWMGRREFAWSLRSDLRMFRKMLRGQMSAEVERVRTEMASRADEEARMDWESPQVVA